MTTLERGKPCARQAKSGRTYHNLQFWSGGRNRCEYVAQDSGWRRAGGGGQLRPLPGADRGVRRAGRAPDARGPHGRRRQKKGLREQVAEEAGREIGEAVGCLLERQATTAEAEAAIRAALAKVGAQMPFEPAAGLPRETTVAKATGRQFHRLAAEVAGSVRAWTARLTPGAARPQRARHEIGQAGGGADGRSPLVRGRRGGGLPRAAPHPGLLPCRNPAAKPPPLGNSFPAFPGSEFITPSPGHAFSRRHLEADELFGGNVLRPGVDRGAEAGHGRFTGDGLMHV